MHSNNNSNNNNSEVLLGAIIHRPDEGCKYNVSSLWLITQHLSARGVPFIPVVILLAFIRSLLEMRICELVLQCLCVYYVY